MQHIIVFLAYIAIGLPVAWLVLYTEVKIKGQFVCPEANFWIYFILWPASGVFLVLYYLLGPLTRILVNSAVKSATKE